MSANNEEFNDSINPADAATSPSVEEPAPQPEASPSSRPSHKKAQPSSFDWSSQGSLVLGSILLVAIILYAVLGSCRLQSSRERKPVVVNAATILPKEVLYGGEKMPGEKFVGLEAIRGDRDPTLIAEIKQVIAQHGTPGDVFQDDIPPEMNIATELRNLFEIYKSNPGELEQLRAGVPPGEWNISDDTVRKVEDILMRTDRKRLEIRNMLLRGDLCFSFEFTFSAEHPELGKIPDTEAIDFLGDYILLEEYAIARALQAGDISAASESLAYIFRIIQLAADVKNPGIRSKTAVLRMHAVDILQTVLLAPNLREADMLRLFDMLQKQLDDWTPDSYAWIGDRASGMKVYNLVMQYGPDLALEPEEIEELKKREVYESFSKGLLRNLAHDQVFYLQAMQKIIDSCEKPFYQRLPLINALTQEIRRTKGAENEIVIAELLLRGVPELMEVCAQDRTKCEMAVLAMATSLQKPVATSRRLHETLTVETLYGKKYEVRQVRESSPPGNIVWVSFQSNSRPFRVPDFSAPGR